MDSFVPIFIVGFLTLAVYRIFELYARRKERMAIIEKLGEQIKLSDANVNLNLPLFQKSGSNTNWALKMSLLMIGVGIGLVIAYCIELATTGGDLSYDDNWHFQQKIEEVHFACVAIFGGIGLLAAYLIERKHKQ